MCHQTVGLVGAELERRGLATVSVSLLREVTVKVCPPRALFVPFPLGYPLGKPGEPGIQLRILRQVFGLLREPGPGPVLEDFET